MKRLISLLLISVLLLSSCSSKDISSNAPNSKTAPKAEVGLTQGKMAPDFTLKNIDGKEVKLSDYRGKTVILNFFGVWCIWCRKEMPGFINVYNDYKNKNVELLIVDNGDTLETITSYMKSNKYDVKPVIDSDSKVVKQYRVTGFPASFIIDKDGIIKAAHTGFMDEEILRNVISDMTK